VGAVGTVGTGPSVGVAVTSTGLSVGATVEFPTGSVVEFPIGSVVGDVVVESTGEIVGTIETIGASVGNCAKGAKLQISLPPITSTGAMSMHCWAF